MPFDGAVDRVKLARPQMAPLTNAALDGATPHVRFAVDVMRCNLWVRRALFFARHNSSSVVRS
jgi:hypothetical protein